MNADIKGALMQLNISWRSFEHNGKKMTKDQVKKVLEYGIEKGYKTTDQFSNEEIDKIIETKQNAR